MKIEDFITLPEVRQQCYLDQADVSEDPFLTLLISASLATIENKTNRKLYELGDPAIPEEGLEFTDDIKIAALLLIGHWYENREDSADVAVKNIPMGFNALISPYVYIPV